MANEEQLALLKQGVEFWNRWREENPDSEIDLSEADLRSADLRSADLLFANLNSANLSGIDLSYADLSHVNLNSANLSYAGLSYAGLSYANISYANLSYANLSYANLSGTNLSDADLSCANLSDTNLSNADLRNANLLDADLSDANLCDADLLSVDLRNANLSCASLRYAYLLSVNLSGANLSDTDLSGANLISANLSDANLRNANLSDANLHNANFSNADLLYANLSDANLSDADFRYADLRYANLYASQVLLSNFSSATLTGACIQDWQMGSSTKFEGIKCDYIFRTISDNKKAERLPVDPDSIFAPGEFEQWLQVRQGALDTIDITFTEGINWQSFFQSLQAVRRQHPDANVAMQSVEEKNGIFVTRLRVKTEVSGEALDKLKADIETQVKTSYGQQLSKARGEIRALERSLDKVVEKLAMTSKNTNYTFNSPVGNLADQNYGEMTAYINQNSEAISQLIESLKTYTQVFPEEQKIDIEITIEDLESDLADEKKRQPGRLTKRLLALWGAVCLISGSVAGVVDFSNNVLELSEKLGVPFSAEIIQQNPHIPHTLPDK